MWIAGLINHHGTPARVIAAAARHDVTVVMSEQLLDELATVLARPKFRRWVRLEDAIGFVEALRMEAEVELDPDRIPRRVRDPFDDYLVALAEQADATIVSGDDDLLSADLESPAITPRQLLDRLGLG